MTTPQSARRGAPAATPNPAAPAAPNADAAATARHFDARAATWDDNPARRALTAAIAQAVVAITPVSRDLRVLEYGCGTAALSFLLAGSVREIVAADASPGMIEQVRQKLLGSGIGNVMPRLLDLTRDPLPADRFDWVVTAMTLHHVADTDALLAALRQLLIPGGVLIVADLMTEDGSFHTDVAVPHHGFDPEDLVRRLRRIGFPDSRWHVVHRLDRAAREYPVFLLSARLAETTRGK